MESLSILKGYINEQPTVKQTPSGKTVIEFTLKVYARFKKDVDRKYLSFFNVVYWPKDSISGNVEREIEKLDAGAYVIFQAEPIQERWEKDGQKHSIVKWSVDGWPEVLHNIGGKKKSDEIPDDDDIPF